MYKLLFLYCFCISSAFAQLTPQKALPGNYMKSEIYQITLSQNDMTTETYVFQDAKYVTNIKNMEVVNAMSDFNHWATFTFTQKPVEVTVKLLRSKVVTCEVFPKSSGIHPQIVSGEIKLRIAKPNTKLYLAINGDDENPLFIFADEPENNAPKPDAKNVLYYKAGIHHIGVKHRIPAEIKTVYLENGAYVKGTFFAENRSDLTIRGRGILSGEGMEFAANSDEIDKQDNISKSAICLNGNGKNIFIEGVTIIRPLKFSVVMRGSGIIRNIKCFGYNYTVDGVVTGNNSVVENSFFKVNDDVVKLYADNMLVRNLVIYHQTNGAIFQLGWSGQKAKNCVVENIEIVKDETLNDSDTKGNHAIINWRKSNNTRSENMVFNNINADNGYCRLIGINLSDNSDGSLDKIIIKNVRLTSQRYPNYARSKTGKIKLTLENVITDGKCTTEKNFLTEGNVEISTTCNN